MLRPRPRSILTLLVLAAACSDPGPIEHHDAWIGIVAGAGEVELGEGFDLTVTRVWRADLVPDPFLDETLAPLTVRLDATVRREEDGYVEETRRYRAWAFAPGEIAVAPPAFAARSRSGAAERTARAARLVLRVRPALDPENPGPAELPDLVPTPFPWIPPAAGLVLVAAFTGVWLRRRRRRRFAPPAVEDVEPETSPEAWEAAIAELVRLREDGLDDDAAVEPFHAAVAGCLREFLVRQRGLGRPDLTSEELVETTAGAMTHFHRGVLADLLGQCDRVKFACARPSRTQRESLLGTGVAFVREIAGVTAGAGGAS